MENIYNVAIPEPKTEGAVLTIMDGKWQLGTGGGGGMYYLTITQEDNKQILSASYNDLLTAIENGQMPMVIERGTEEGTSYIQFKGSVTGLASSPTQGYMAQIGDVEYFAADPDDPLASDSEQ